MNELNYQEKLKEVKRILENNGYNKNSWQAFQKEDSLLKIDSYSGLILDFLEVYQALYKVNDYELIDYFEKNAKPLIKIIIDSNFKSFKEFIEPNFEVEKIDNFDLRQILQALALSKILKKVIKLRGKEDDNN